MSKPLPGGMSKGLSSAKIKAAMVEDVLQGFLRQQTGEEKQAFFESCTPADQDYLRRALTQRERRVAQKNEMDEAKETWITAKAAWMSAGATMGAAAADYQLKKLAYDSKRQPTQAPTT